MRPALKLLPSLLLMQPCLPSDEQIPGASGRTCTCRSWSWHLDQDETISFQRKQNNGTLSLFRTTLTRPKSIVNLPNQGLGQNRSCLGALVKYATRVTTLGAVGDVAAGSASKHDLFCPSPQTKLNQSKLCYGQNSQRLLTIPIRYRGCCRLSQNLSRTLTGWWTTIWPAWRSRVRIQKAINIFHILIGSLLSQGRLLVSMPVPMS